MTIKEFVEIANSIRFGGTVDSNSNGSRWVDKNGNSYLIEDGGYSRTLYYNGKIYFADCENNVF